MLLTDEQWAVLQPIFPPARATRWSPTASFLTPSAGSSPPAPPGTTCPEAPPHQTVSHCYRQWLRSGIFDQALALLRRDLKERGGFDLAAACRNGDMILGRRGR